MRFGVTETNCRSCGQVFAASDLDRYLWCPNCRKLMRKRGAVWGRLVGLTAAVAVALYLILVVSPSRLQLLWALPPLMTYVLTSRIAVALVQGYYRARGSVVESTAESEG